MNYSDLLKQQVEKNIGAFSNNVPGLENLLNDIHNSYKSFEKEKELLIRAYKYAEEEFTEVNASLINEVKKRKNLIEELKLIIQNLNNSNIKNSPQNINQFSTIIIEEINKRKKVEDTLKNLIENLNFGILLRDSQNSIIYNNQILLDIFKIQKPPANFNYYEFLTIVEEHKENNSGISNSYFSNSYISFKQTSDRQTIILKNGKIFEEVRIKYEYGEGLRGVIHTFSDVTEKEISNGLIKKSELRNSQILNGSPDAIILINVLGEIKFSNQKTTQIFEMSTEQLLGRSIFDLISRDLLSNIIDSSKQF